MNKIYPTVETQAIEWINLISTNIKWIFLSIQWDEWNRVITFFTSINEDNSNFDNSIKEKIYSSNITVPDWYNIIWILWKWYYKHLNYYNENHYYKKVQEDYRWLWIWTLMLNIKESLDWILEEEYSRKISWINFLLRNWFKLKWKINENWDEKIISKKDESNIYSLISKYLESEISEEVLDNTYTFSRKLKQI